MRIVALYSNRNRPSASSIGFVNSVKNEVLSLNSITTSGEPDGIVMRKLSDIFKLEIGDVYAQKLGMLISKASQAKASAPFSLSGVRLESFLAALESARKAQVVVSVWLQMDSDDTYVSGFVGRIMGKQVLLNKLDDFGRPDGNVIFGADDVDALDIDGESEHRLAFLHSNAKYDYSWPD